MLIAIIILMICDMLLVILQSYGNMKHAEAKIQMDLMKKHLKNAQEMIDSGKQMYRDAVQKRKDGIRKRARLKYRYKKR